MSETTNCPICGRDAEVGCLYGRDGSWFAMRWLAGEASMSGNMVTGMGGGEAVGEVGVFCGPYVQSVRCRHCRRIVLDC